LIRVWRLCKERWANTAFDGEGARIAGGRWNHKGDRVVYAADSLSLAAIELFVHLDPEDAPTDLVAIYADISESLSVESIDLSGLPDSWRDYPAPTELQNFGSEWLKSNRSVVLVCPSVVVPREHCYLLNPSHPQFGEIKVGEPEAFHFDPRMWK
jgi:RES domain-containing protein